MISFRPAELVVLKPDIRPQIEFFFPNETFVGETKQVVIGKYLTENGDTSALKLVYEIFGPRIFQYVKISYIFSTTEYPLKKQPG